MRGLLFLLKRTLFPSETKLLSFALWISVVGVCLGIVLLVVVLGVMSGFQHLLSDNYTRITSDIVVIPRLLKNDQMTLDRGLQQIPGVRAVSPFVLGAAMLIRKGVSGVVVEGIDLETINKVTPWDTVWQEPPDKELQARSPYWLWIGTQLAKKMGLKRGDSVDLMIADGAQKKVIPFAVTAITKFGIYDHDLRQIRMDLTTARGIFHVGGLSDTMYKVALHDHDTVEVTAEAIRAQFSSGVLVKPWFDLHKNIFLAVKHQKQMLFFILQIIISLAAMNVVNLLLMNAHHRRRDVAILRVMGISFKKLFVLFLAQGMIVSLLGVGTGIVLGKVACKVIEKWQPSLLSESIYNVTRLPIRVENSDLIFITVAAFIVCLVFTIIPSLRASKRRPVEVLRYE